MTEQDVSAKSPFSRAEGDVEIPSAKGSRVVTERGQKPLCVFDVETTGLRDRDTIVSIGALRVEHFEGVPRVVQQFEALVLFQSLLDPVVAHLIGYDEAEWRENAVSIDVALRGFFPLWHRAEVLCAWNILFDWQKLQAAARQIDWQAPTRPTRPLDLMAYAWPLYRDGLIENMKLDTVARHLGLQREDRVVHRPLADAQLCHEVYRRLCPGAGVQRSA